MPRVVFVCSDASQHAVLRACLSGYEVADVANLKQAARALTEASPDLLLARVDAKDRAGLDVVRLMRRSRIHAPVVIVLPRAAAALESEAWQLGVRHFVRAPVRYDELRAAIDLALRTPCRAEGSSDPPITSIERQHNLSVLVEKLNRHMKCPAGTNRVLIRSQVHGVNDKTEPRVCLRCPIRQAVGLNEYVFFEHIRDHCCKDVAGCDAVQQYKKLGKAEGS